MIKLIISALLLASSALAQDKPTLKQRPVNYAPDNRPDTRVKHESWKRRVFKLASSAAAAEIVDDAILDPTYRSHKGWRVAIGPAAGAFVYVFESAVLKEK